jgi:uncharacterized protein YegP (UPF0339 family)
MYYFTITRDNDGYRARFYSRSNGKLIWWTEGYTERRGAEEAIQIMRGNAASAGSQ